MPRIGLEILDEAVAMTNRCPTSLLLVPALVVCEENGFEQYVTFIVDTGAMFSTLDLRDLDGSGISLDDLEAVPESEWLHGIVAVAQTKKMQNIKLFLLDAQNPEAMIEVKLDRIDVIQEPSVTYVTLLGEDILRDFRMVAYPAGGEAYLESPN